MMVVLVVAVAAIGMVVVMVVVVDQVQPGRRRLCPGAGEQRVMRAENGGGRLHRGKQLGIVRGLG